MEITNVNTQTVSSGANLIFAETPIEGCCAIVHRQGSGLVKLRGLSTTQCRARFRASFGCNAAIPTAGTIAPIQLAITVDGQPLQSTVMIATPAAVNEYFNLNADVFIDVPAGCCSTIGIENITTESVLVANANLIIERVA